MAIKVEMVPVEKVVDAYSNVCVADTNQLISSLLSNSDLKRYSRAMLKIGNGDAINRKDLTVLDKIDAITYQHHGMCLKDSLVTKARIKACKKYKLKFIDRDNLVEHMNLMLSANEIQKQEICKDIYDFFIGKLGEDVPIKLSKILHKLDNGVDLNLIDLDFLSQMESLVDAELDWTIINEELKNAIDKSCKKLGVYFQNLQKVIVH
jgi:hypothetical protein